MPTEQDTVLAQLELAARERHRRILNLNSLEQTALLDEANPSDKRKKQRYYKALMTLTLESTENARKDLARSGQPYKDGNPHVHFDPAAKLKTAATLALDYLDKIYSEISTYMADAMKVLGLADLLDGVLPDDAASQNNPKVAAVKAAVAKIIPAGATPGAHQDVVRNISRTAFIYVAHAAAAVPAPRATEQDDDADVLGHLNTVFQRAFMNLMTHKTSHLHDAVHAVMDWMHERATTLPVRKAQTFTNGLHAAGTVLSQSPELQALVRK